MRIVKEVIDKWEKRNNEDKEEGLESRTEKREEIRALGK